ncbi:uncharacterized protein LOC141596454 [Silene latifolia]|uniref:uncharacterized protein LOC141596454 n=1 Tax=Silene latifolia TaxID=37657 RepID=UPI003D784279
MDVPVAYWSFPPRSNAEPQCIGEALENALIFDDKDEFLRLIKDPKFKQISCVYDAEQIFRLDALNCCIAVLNGETKGIIDFEDILEEGRYTPLHLAALNSSPSLTKYLLEKGDSIDVHSHLAIHNLKHCSFIDFIIGDFSTALTARTWTPRKSVYELLVVLCCTMRPELEILRMLVQNTQNKQHVRQTFMGYAHKRELLPVALLFLAAPELFLSSYSVAPELSSSSVATLYNVLYSLEKRTDIEEAMFLLVDALAMTGHKFVAYTRLPFPNGQAYLRSHLDVAFLVRDASNKQELSSRDDYFLRFFKPVRPGPESDDQLRNISGHEDDFRRLWILSFELKRHDLDQAYINTVIPSLATEDGDRLNNDIEKKLLLMPILYGRLEDLIRTPKREKIPLQKFPSQFSPSYQSYRSYTASAKHGLDVKNTPTNSLKLTKLPKLNSLNSWGNMLIKPPKLNSPSSRLSQFVNIAKRLIK